MSRCGCDVELPGECNCVLASSDTVAVTGAGTTADPYELAPVLDPDPDNLLVAGTDGLSAAFPARVLSPPRARVTHSVGQTVAIGAGQDLAFDTTVYDKGGLRDPVFNDRLVATFAGAWAVGACVAWAPFGVGNANRDIAVGIRVNGGALVANRITHNSAGEFIPMALLCHTVVELAVGDYVSVRASHTHGATFLTEKLGRMSPTLWMTYQGD